MLVFWDVVLVKSVLRVLNRVWGAFAPLPRHATFHMPLMLAFVIQHHIHMDIMTVIALLSTTLPKQELYHAIKRANALVPCIMDVTIHA